MMQVLVEIVGDQAPQRDRGWSDLQLNAGPITTSKVAATLILAAVIEEVLFRGVLQGLLRRFLPSSVALSIAAVLFAVVHIGNGFGWLQIAPILASGLVYGAFFERTRSLAPPIAAHVAHNALFILYVILGDVAWAVIVVLVTAGLAFVVRRPVKDELALGS